MSSRTHKRSADSSFIALKKKLSRQFFGDGSKISFPSVSRPGTPAASPMTAHALEWNRQMDSFKPSLWSNNISDDTRASFMHAKDNLAHLKTDVGRVYPVSAPASKTAFVVDKEIEIDGLHHSKNTADVDALSIVEGEEQIQILKAERLSRFPSTTVPNTPTFTEKALPAFPPLFTSTSTGDTISTTLSEKFVENGKNPEDMHENPLKQPQKMTLTGRAGPKPLKLPPISPQRPEMRHSPRSTARVQTLGSPSTPGLPVPIPFPEDLQTSFISTTNSSAATNSVKVQTPASEKGAPSWSAGKGNWSKSPSRGITRSALRMLRQIDDPAYAQGHRDGDNGKDQTVATALDVLEGRFSHKYDIGNDEENETQVSSVVAVKSHDFTGEAKSIAAETKDATTQTELFTPMPSPFAWTFPLNASNSRPLNETTTSGGFPFTPTGIDGDQSPSLYPFPTQHPFASEFGRKPSAIPVEPTFPGVANALGLNLSKPTEYTMPAEMYLDRPIWVTDDPALMTRSQLEEALRLERKARAAIEKGLSTVRALYEGALAEWTKQDSARKEAERERDFLDSVINRTSDLSESQNLGAAEELSVDNS